MTPWTVACQAPLSMGFPRQESWGGILISLFIDRVKFDSVLTLNISFNYNFSNPEVFKILVIPGFMKTVSASCEVTVLSASNWVKQYPRYQGAERLSYCWLKELTIVDKKCS